MTKISLAGGMFDEVIANNFKPVLCKIRVNKILFFLSQCLLPGTLNTRAWQKANYALYANNIYHFITYVNWPCYNNQEALMIGVVADDSLCDERQYFTSNKQLEPGR